MVSKHARRSDFAFAMTMFVCGAAGCSNEVTPHGDAADVVIDATDIAPSRDSSTDSFADAPLTDAGDIPRVSTCSELHLDAVSAMPGHDGIAYPGSTLALTGAGFTAVTRVVIGGVEMPFTRASDTALTSTVPSMLAVGDRGVIVQTERCSSAQTITVSRLVAAIRANASEALLFDANTLTPLGALDLGASDITQAQFTLDGAGLITRDATGAVRRTLVGATATTATISPVSSNRFVFAQGNVQPTRGLLVIPGRLPPGALLFDSLAGSIAPYAVPSSDPRSLALSLDGFRGLVLDHDGALYRGELVFAPSATWTRVGDANAFAGATSVILSQAQSTLAVHLGAVFTDAATPTLVPLNVFSGVTGAPITMPAGATRPRFVSGDVVVVDTVTPSVVAYDITDLQGEQWVIPLEGEASGPEVATRTAISLYHVGAIVLSAASGGVASGHTVHFIDFQIEPPVERGHVEIPDARGMVGMQGTGDPFIVWTAGSLVRVLGQFPDAAHEIAVSLPSGGGDVRLTVVQP